MGTMQEFLEIKKKLLYCPIDGNVLIDSQSNSAVRRCIVHGDVFSIQSTVTGYFVAVELDARQVTADPPSEELFPTCPHSPQGCRFTQSINTPCEPDYCEFPDFMKWREQKYGKRY